MASPFDLTRDPARWPAFPGPLPCPEQAVEPARIDYNGHMNMAYYHVAFDRAVDFAYDQLGLGAHYVETAQASFYRGGARLLSPGAEPGGALHRELAAPGLRRQTAAFSSTSTAESDSSRPPNKWPYTSPWRLGERPFPEEAVARLDYVAKAHAALPGQRNRGGFWEFPSPEGNGNWRDRIL